jgi:hypothetical protein
MKLPCVRLSGVRERHINSDAFYDLMILLAARPKWQRATRALEADRRRAENRYWLKVLALSES